MELAGISAVADLVAAIAVVASLVFVAYEIRQSTRQTQLANWRALLDSLVAFKGLTAEVAYSDFIARGHADYDALLPHEKHAYGMYLERGVHVIGNFTKHMDMMPPGYDGLDLAIRALLRDLLTTPGARRWWQDTRDGHRFMKETIRRIDRIQAEASGGPGAP